MTHARIAFVAVAMASACNLPPQYCEGEAAPVSEQDAPPTPQARVVAQVLPVESAAVDMLFVIDDSRSMTEEQEQLGIWSNEMFDVLSASGELPDLHIAVISSSVPIPGLSQCRTGGSLHVGGAVIQDGGCLRDVAGPQGRLRNYKGTLEDNFAKMARVGDDGCGFEQPFAAARRALTTKVFVRHEALLLVVFVTDEAATRRGSARRSSARARGAQSRGDPVRARRCMPAVPGRRRLLSG